MRMMKNPRRELLLVLENLAYLDDKPVLEPERLQIEAFKRGGEEEMKRVRKEYAESLHKRQREGVERGTKIFNEAREERKL